ncbi:unnamed protein product [Pleuronectes platessa]|uniref:Uncharacterized protein n=1 Tax=Pleuronectes platessa TaxID=8262 RepID=A0A9N7YG72_PLEPL|nr:unnamed protein product [Pleuronectes platessa]
MARGSEHFFILSVSNLVEFPRRWREAGFTTAAEEEVPTRPPGRRSSRRRSNGFVKGGEQRATVEYLTVKRREKVELGVNLSLQEADGWMKDGEEKECGVGGGFEHYDAEESIKMNKMFHLDELLRCTRATPQKKTQPDPNLSVLKSR